MSHRVPALLSLVLVAAAGPALAQDDEASCPGGSMTLDAPSLKAEGTVVAFRGDADVAVTQEGLAVAGGRATLWADGKGAVGGTFAGASTRLQIDGGNVVFTGSSEVDLVGSTLQVQPKASANWFGTAVSINQDGTRVLVGSEGAFRLHQGSGFVVVDSALVVDGGSLEFHDTSTLSSGAGSKVVVRDGSFSVDGSSALKLGEGSTISIQGGSFEVKDDARFGLYDSAFVVGGGSVVFDDTTSVDLGSSSLRITGGDLLLQGSSRLDLGEGSTVAIRGGSLSLADQSAFRMDAGGRFRVVEGAVLLPGGGTLDVAAYLAACPTALRVYADKDGAVVTCERKDANPDTCGGFLSAKRGPPQWECEDRCLEEKGPSVQCNTTHL